MFNLMSFFNLKKSKKDQIFPYIKLLEEIKPNEKVVELDFKGKIFFKDFMSDLIISYAIDTGSSFEIVSYSYLDDLNVSKDELHKIALDNFTKLVKKKLVIHGDSSSYLMLTIDGNFEASLLLLDYLWKDLLKSFKDNLIVSVPARDVVLVTGFKNKKSIDLIKEKSKKIRENGDHILSKHLFEFTENGWKIFE